MVQFFKEFWLLKPLVGMDVSSGVFNAVPRGSRIKVTIDIDEFNFSREDVREAADLLLDLEDQRILIEEAIGGK